MQVTVNCLLCIAVSVFCHVCSTTGCITCVLCMCTSGLLAVLHMCYVCMCTGLSFYTYETLKALLLSHLPHIAGTPCPGNDGNHVLNLPAKLLCGGLAGAMAQTVS
jgi:hypothetical protein